jgi:GntR family transcriptional regulator
MIPAIRIEDNGVPRYVQIRDQLLRAIGAGVLAPGSQMPTMRELAVELSVDLNTVRHAYDDLEKGGFINIVRARGTYVAQHPPPEDTAGKAARLESLAHETIAIANAAGIDPAQLASRILEMNHNKRGKK